MAVTPTVVRIPRIQGGRPIVDTNGAPQNDFLRAMNDILAQIEGAFNGIDEALAAAGIAQGAALAAQTAATAANTAAAAAATAAATNAASVAATNKEQALVNSYIEPSSVLTAVPLTISVAAHTRFYADGTSVPVNAGSVGSTSSGIVNYVSYSDTTRAGGAVTYIATSVQPPQTGDTHVVGGVNVPTSGTSTGGRGPQKPGFVDPDD